MKFISKCLQGLIAISFVWALFLPFAINIHKGFIDKPGDWWYGFDVVFLSPMILIITLIFPVAFAMAAIAPFLARPSNSWIAWSVVTWAISLVVCWLIYAGNRHDLMPGFYLFAGVLLLWPWPTVWNYRLTPNAPPPPRPPSTRAEKS